MDLFDKKKNEEIKKMGGRRGGGFNILNSDSTDGHGGYGAGTLNLNNISPVIVDPEGGDAFVDMGALHARSEIEKRIKFLKNKEEVPNGRLYWLVWVTVDHRDGKPYYAGVAACEMTVDKEIRRGYKSLPEHVNNMDRSLKRKLVVDKMDDKSKQILAEFLQSHSEEMWKNSDEDLHQALSTT
ncbi:YwhD family protein [Bacillus sp. FJAT-44742]|uniref:YwhD family protein n=1 Tax=Bacillus sp. FJAT-44742 TaxID=2014005 RepID=UPI000C2305EE|nr:YwhD family protein [Bacillus sp. FJAT-44742]